MDLLLAQAAPTDWTSLLVNTGVLGIVLLYLDRRERAWRKYDAQQSKNCHDAQREMLMMSGEMALVLGRAVNVIERDGSMYSYPEGHKLGPSDSQMKRENPLRQHLERLRKTQEKSLNQKDEDEKDSKEN